MKKTMYCLIPNGSAILDMLLDFNQAHSSLFDIHRQTTQTNFLNSSNCPSHIDIALVTLGIFGMGINNFEKYVISIPRNLPVIAVTHENDYDQLLYFFNRKYPNVGHVLINEFSNEFSAELIRQNMLS